MLDEEGAAESMFFDNIDPKLPLGFIALSRIAPLWPNCILRYRYSGWRAKI
jgi:hypothetical protein